MTGGRDHFLAVALANPIVAVVLDRADTLDLPDWYLAAGCLFQTVWNELHGFDCQYGIKDYDLIYFDGEDLSWEAEDLVIRRCAAMFDDLPAEIEVRNQARVHLWYEDHFGLPCPPLTSSAAAIDTYAAHACRVGARKRGARVDVYAPSGFDDLLQLVLRPNPSVAPRHVYETKSARWARLWPRLQSSNPAEDCHRTPGRHASVGRVMRSSRVGWPGHHLNTAQYANNRVECDHGRLKARLRPMRGLKTDATARVIIRGHAFIQNLRRGHYELGVDARNRHLRLAAAFDQLARTI